MNKTYFYLNCGGKMIKYIISVLLCLIAFASFKVFGHPPSEVELKFDFQTKILNVKVSHSTNDVSKHYIKKIEVYLDDELMVGQNFKTQKDNKIQEALYFLNDAAVGNKIKVKATCSIFGSKTEEIVIEEQKEKG
jgi:desulfoferrodoxin (superoxide reductase-like protein)